MMRHNNKAGKPIVDLYKIQDKDSADSNSPIATASDWKFFDPTTFSWNNSDLSSTSISATSGNRLGINSKVFGRGSERACHLMAIFKGDDVVEKFTVKHSVKMDDATSQVDTVKYHENFRKIYSKAYKCAVAFNSGVANASKVREARTKR